MLISDVIIAIVFTIIATTILLKNEDKITIWRNTFKK